MRTPDGAPVRRPMTRARRSRSSATRSPRRTTRAGSLPVILEVTVEATGAAGGRVLDDDRELARVGDGGRRGAARARARRVRDRRRDRLVVDPPEGGFSPDATAARRVARLAGRDRARERAAPRRRAAAGDHRRAHGPRQPPPLHRGARGARSRARSGSARRCRSLFADLDDFKRINDRFGHPAGDDVLRRSPTCCAATCATIDTAARLGGEEFAVLLPGTDLEGAVVVGRADPRTLADEAIHARGGRRQRPDHQHRRRRVRLGYAATSCSNGPTRPSIVPKEQGKNRVVGAVTPKLAPRAASDSAVRCRSKGDLRNINR